MNFNRILVLDEDEEMRNLLSHQLKSCEFPVDQAASFPIALIKLESVKFSLLLMNAKIPEYCTSEVLKKIREIYRPEELAILMVNSPASESKQEAWRAMGACEFLAQPFDRVQLLGKVKMLLRKVIPQNLRAEEKPGQMRLGELTLDLQSFDVYCHGSRLHLTPNEFKLLQALLSHPGDVLSRERLIELVQGYGIAVIDRAVDTHIFSLRKKLGTLGDSIETVRGSGYRMALAPQI